MLAQAAQMQGKLKQMQDDLEMLEDLILAAVAEAQRKAATAAQEEMQKATGDLNLPFKLPF